jgi:arsenate reductase
MAEALFNRLAPNNLRAISAGTKPSDRVNPQAVESMKEVGLDISEKKLKLLTSEMIEKADRIITMGCGADVCPASFLPKIEDWKIEDPFGQPMKKFREVRDEIRRRVDKPVEEMTR